MHRPEKRGVDKREKEREQVGEGESGGRLREERENDGRKPRAKAGERERVLIS